MKKDLQMEIAKTQATLKNLIEAVKRQEEGKCEVDILGSLYALADSLNNVDDAINEAV